MSLIDLPSVAPRYPVVGHRHARGLTRDLMRKVRDAEAGLAPLDRLLRMPLRSCGSARERSKVLARLRTTIRKHSVVHQHAAPPGGTTGLRLTAARIPWAADDMEDLLVVQRARLHDTGSRIEVSNQGLAHIGQHAICRMFERLRTIDHAVTMAELRGGLRYLSDLFDACTETGVGQRVLQITVPTRNGTFLGWRSRDSEAFFLRTWVATGGNVRIDRTQAAIKAWAATPASDRSATFRNLLCSREHQWLLRRHIA